MIPTIDGIFIEVFLHFERLVFKKGKLEVDWLGQMNISYGMN
jgi:hypothetical protein